jgi:hypothetical protein
VREAVEELLEACQRLRPQPDEFEGPRYQRLAHLERLIATGQVAPDLRPLTLALDRVEA